MSEKKQLTKPNKQIKKTLPILKHERTSKNDRRKSRSRKRLLVGT